jgi:phosphoglycolate phosphatase-like HAD superfamily hydrolase
MRHVIWDWNGTLLVDQHVVLGGVNRALGAVGGAPITAEAYRRVPKRPVRPFYEALAGRPLDDREWRQIDDVYHEAYAERVDDAYLAPDARQVLSDTAGCGMSQSLLSMWPHRDLVPLVDAHALTSWFCLVEGYRGECGGGKTEHLAEHVATLGARLGLAPADLLVVGDTVDDGVAAHAVGAECVLVETDSYSREALEAVGVPVAGTLTEALSMARESAAP